MKKTLLILTGCLLALLSAGQNIPGFVPYKSKNQHLGLAADSLQYIPVKDTSHTPYRIGAMTMRPQDSSVYVGVRTAAGTKRWERLAKYSELSSLAYVDSVWRTPGVDSFYWRKNGVTYAVKDSLGVSTRDRFGFTGEDDRGTTNRYYSGTGPTEFLLDSLFGFQVNTFGLVGGNLHYATLMQYADLGYNTSAGAFFDGGARQRNAGISLSPTPGIASMVGGNDADSLSGISAAIDGLTLNQTHGNYFVENLDEAPNMTDMTVMLWNTATEKWYRINPDSVGGAGGGYTNLTQFVGQSNWQMFYSNGSGDVTELAFGTSGKVLTSNGASAAPTWEDPAGGISSLSAIGSSPNANGATITGSVLNLEPASASFGGVVTTGTQTIAGEKNMVDSLFFDKGAATSHTNYINIASGGFGSNTEAKIMIGSAVAFGGYYNRSYSLGPGFVVYTGSDFANPAFVVDQSKSALFYGAISMTDGLTVSKATGNILTIGNGSSSEDAIHINTGAYPNQNITFRGLYENPASRIQDYNDGTGDHALKFYTYPVGGPMHLSMEIRGTKTVKFYGGGIFNEDGGDYDFRIEGDTEANLFFSDASTDRIGIGTSSPAAQLHTTGTVRLAGIGGAGIVLSDADGDLSVGTLTESTYSPTLTNTTNIAASTAATTYYIRIGDWVHVWGTVDIDATTALTLSELGMSIPVGGTFGNVYELAGTASFEDNTAVQIKGDTANARAIFKFTPQSATNNKYSFHFSYKYFAP